MYSFESRIRYSEVDSEGRITLNAILDYYQDCSSFHSEDIGVGIDYLKQEGIAWVLSSWQIEVKRYPMYGETVKISTWPYDFKGFMGYRNFTMESEAGEMLSFANSVWVLLDIKTGRPTRITPQMVEVYTMSPKFPMECDSRKIGLPEEMTAREPFAVQKYHIDTNQHVNNGRYVGMAQEYLDGRFKIGKMRAEYRKSAVYQDVIYPFIREEAGKVTVNLADEAGKPYAIVELEEDR